MHVRLGADIAYWLDAVQTESSISGLLQQSVEDAAQFPPIPIVPQALLGQPQGAD